MDHGIHPRSSFNISVMWKVDISNPSTGILPKRSPDHVIRPIQKLPTSTFTLTTCVIYLIIRKKKIYHCVLFIQILAKFSAKSTQLISADIFLCLLSSGDEKYIRFSKRFTLQQFLCITSVLLTLIKQV